MFDYHTLSNPIIRLSSNNRTFDFVRVVTPGILVNRNNFSRPTPTRFPPLHVPLGTVFNRTFNNIGLGDYSPIFTSHEATNCFSIITLMIIRENKSIDQFPTPKHQQIWLPF